MDYPFFLTALEKWRDQQQGKPGSFKTGDHFAGYGYTTAEETQAAKTKVLEINGTTGKLAVKGVKISDAGNELFLRINPFDLRNPLFKALGIPRFKAQFGGNAFKVG